MTFRPALPPVTAFAALAVTALAASAASADPRISTRFYEPSSVVVVHGRPGIESTIAFADDEHIENVAVGNSAAWQVTPNKRANLLFVKPSGVRAHTNMTVITDQRTYLFDLVSGAGIAPVYMLRFTYPARPRAELAAVAPLPIPAAALTPAPESDALAAAAPPASVVPPPAEPAGRGMAWATGGDRQLFPQRTFDDGHSTFLAWPRDATLPAILTRGPGGQEGPVNFSIRGDYIVLDMVPAQIVLRAGKQMATLTPPARSSAAAPPPPAVAMADSASARP